MKKKIALDVLLLIALLILINRESLNEVFHEPIAVTLFFLIVVHFIMHFKWMKYTAKNLTSKKQPWLTKIMFLLVIVQILVFAFMFFSGLNISENLFPNLLQGNERFWREIHETLPNIIIALIAIHIALQWKILWNFGKSLTKKKSST